MSNNYNPNPPRVWSRVENPCIFTVPGSDYTSTFIPLTGRTVTQAQADYQMKQFYKGNILQYKGNSARLTKSQKYSQLARMAGPNRTKVFATQSETYSNPNTTGLLRSGFETYPFPNQIVGAPNNISGPFAYGIPNPNDCSSNSIQDGGILVCGTYANPCTGEIIKQGVTNATICTPASASNVPGPGFLCWNNKVQTFFPRQRYFMNNSGTKWPQGYKGFVSALTPTPPLLFLISSNGTSITLSWSYNSNGCIPISNFKIYQNNTLVSIVPNTITSGIFNLICGTNIFYVTSVSSNIESIPSNNIFADGDIDIDANFTITSGSYIQTSNSIYNTILTFTSSSSILFNANVGIIDCIVVGGGAGGSNGGSGGSGGGGSGGNGGGGGQVINSSFSCIVGTTYTLTIGGGGTGASFPTNGNPSLISLISTIVTASGGIINSGGTGGAGGSILLPPSNGLPGTSGSLAINGYGGGGGGGGGGNGSGSGGGGPGLAAEGGSAGNSGGTGGAGGTLPLSNGLPGETASANTGGGGGGGGGGGISGVGGTGGNGGSGIIILKFNSVCI